jgi:hypothetical protein
LFLLRYFTVRDLLRGVPPVISAARTGRATASEAATGFIAKTFCMTTGRPFAGPVFSYGRT